MDNRVSNLALLVLGFLAGALTSGIYLVTAHNAAAQVTSQPANCQTFTPTGHTVCGRFPTYWQEHGGLAQQGYPLSEEFAETSPLS